MTDIKRKIIFTRFIHVYVICSFIAPVFLLASRELGYLFYTAGASSGYICFGISTAEDIQLSIPLGVLSMLWSLLLPLALIICYILALKNKYLPLSILALVDAIIVVAFVIFAHSVGNEYGVQYFFLDAIFSTISSVFMLLTFYPLRRKKH